MGYNAYVTLRFITYDALVLNLKFYQNYRVRVHLIKTSRYLQRKRQINVDSFNFTRYLIAAKYKTLKQIAELIIIIIILLIIIIIIKALFILE